jgi:hypothetical protein
MASNTKAQIRKELNRIDRLLAKLNKSANRESVDTYRARKTVGKSIKKLDKIK